MLGIEARWRAAQDAELEFWQSYRSVPTFRDYDAAVYSRECFDRFGLSPESLREKTVVDIGCGPVGMIFHLPPCACKVAVDPLLGRVDIEGDSTGVKLLRAAGEYLPLRSRCTDIVLCTNTLDHVAEPWKVLSEIRRILRPGGRLFLAAHTFPAPLCRFLGFDKPHPHHWSMVRLVETVRACRFAIEHCRQEPMRFPVSLKSLLDRRAWKHLAANLFVSITYVEAVRSTA